MAQKKKLNIGLIGAAAAGGLTVGLVADKVLPSLGLPDNVTPFIPVALGVFLATQKNPMLVGIGVGMIGSAAPKALQAVGINIGAPFNMVPGGAAYVETLTLPDSYQASITGNNPAMDPIGIGGNYPAFSPMEIG